MAVKSNVLVHYLTLLLIAAVVATTAAISNRVGATGVNSTCPEKLKGLEEEFQKYRSKALLAVKQIFRDEQNCPSCQENCDAVVKRKLAVAQMRMERKTKVLVEGK